MNWNTILIYVAIAFGGYLLGLLDRWVTDRMRRKRNPEPAAPIPTPSGPPDLSRLGLAPDGKPYLELDGARVDPTSLTPEQRSRLIALLVHARPWVEGPATPPPARAGSDRPGQPLVPAAPAVEPARLNLARGMRSFLEESVIRKEPEPEDTGLVGLIDAILQRRLQGSPLDGKEIRLFAAPDGSVRVRVGRQTYEGVDAVPDPQIKAAIRAAIEEWEKGGK